MKKFFITLVSLALSVVTMAGNFVMLSYSGRAELEKHFSDPNLTVHFYTDSEVFATAERFEANMVMLDENAFSDAETYTLVYCPKEQQQRYDALYATQNYVIVSGIVEPYKNDGAVAIFNKKASLAKLTRDFPVVTEEDPRIREMLNQVNSRPLFSTCRIMVAAFGTPIMPLPLPIGLPVAWRLLVLRSSSSLSMPIRGWAAALRLLM